MSHPTLCALLLAASSSLEWTRLYHWESRVPGQHAGGVLPYAHQVERGIVHGQGSRLR